MTNAYGNDKYEFYMKELKEALPIGESFDVLERKISIGGRDASLFFVDGLVKGSIMQYVLSFFLRIEDKSMERVHSADDFMKYNMPFLDSLVEEQLDMILKHLFAGLVAVVISGIDKVVIVDARDYPGRGVEEPSKEKSLRGAKDGFTEGFMTNIALVRRRIRDCNLVFESHIVGEESKTDTCIVYMKGRADQSFVKSLGQSIDNIKLKGLTVGEQSLVEALLREKCRTSKKAKKDGKPGKLGLARFNPLPKVRYTQRPDVVAAHVEEGRVAILVDNTPTAILLPACIFDFTQDVDDYYFPELTGNYFRILRIINSVMILFLTPIFLLIAEGYIPAHEAIKFFIPKTDYAIPLFWQFMILEVAIDGLKLASLNTPDSLGMSLSVIGALILGEFSVSSGWFIPQTILVMSVVALASFTQPSMELGYAIKFARIFILVGVALYGIWGAVTALVIDLLIIGTTKTISGTSYIYPLIPFDGKALKKLMFRTQR